MVTISWQASHLLAFWLVRPECGKASPSVAISGQDDSFDYDACLVRVRQGDERAAKDLVAQLHDSVMRIVRGRMPRQICEEDVMQDVFVKMFHKLHQFKGAVPFEHWVSRIAVNTTLNALRGSRVRMELRRADLTDAEDQALDHVASTDDLEDPDRVTASRELLGKLLDRLSPKERMAIELLDIEGHSSDEAAEISGVKAAALRARAARARRKLRNHLKNLLTETSS
ncbi:MAG: sigma-70 family RNA polymerase sigma factor [Verrucomicrobiales bacterium]|nr:sigma-70 family RNA polymerase sigma factor [Verrucomicrobiales bacterium]